MILWGGGGGCAPVEPPLEVLPIYVWSPTSRVAAPSPAMLDEMRRDRFGAVGSEDSLLSHTKLAAGVVSSILRDSDLKKVDALSIEEALFFCFRESLMYVQAPSPIIFFIVSVLLTDRLFLVLWQVATYAKGLARRANLTKGSTKATKSYKAKVASLTSERSGLRA